MIGGRSTNTRIVRLAIWLVGFSPSLSLLGFAPSLRWVWTGRLIDARKVVAVWFE